MRNASGPQLFILFVVLALLIGYSAWMRMGDEPTAQETATGSILEELPQDNSITLPTNQQRDPVQSSYGGGVQMNGYSIRGQ